MPKLTFWPHPIPDILVLSKVKHAISVVHYLGGKIKDFKNILGAHVDNGLFKRKKISGSGNIHQKKLWLNVRDANSQAEIQGHMNVAINDFRDYVSVQYVITNLTCNTHIDDDDALFIYRPAAFTIQAGRAYVLKITPSVLKSTQSFHRLTLDERQCRFNDEKMESWKSMFIYYTQKTCAFECILRKVISRVSITQIMHQ
jgi:hypothetical protein